MERVTVPFEPLTVEDYLRLEESSPVRHEYIQGQLYALAGVSSRHDEIVVNLIIQFGVAARSGQCRVHTGEFSLRVAEDRFYYPDIAVYCDPPSVGERFGTEPSVVVEVLSPSTAGTDRREKLFAYRGIVSLETYLIVYQDEPRVEHHYRDEAGAWRQRELIGDGRITIRCLDADLSLAEIYAGITFSGT